VWTFYEIDPAVERIARDARFFTSLQDCLPGVPVVLGDARLSLARAPDATYDLLVLDAYSSDAPPMHLLTREALALYLAKLAPRGLLVFNVSNRHPDLEPVLAGLARDGGLAARVRDDAAVRPEDSMRGKTPSTWVVMARALADLGALAADPRWQPLRGDPGDRVWTDSYGSLLAVFKWR
jgi:spermidine synthase